MSESYLAAAQDAEAFFENSHGRRRFVARRMAEWLTEETPVAKGGQQLYVYRNGVYVPGEASLNLRIAHALDDQWTKSRETETFGWLWATVPELTAQPPSGLINCVNGLYDRRSGELRPHDPTLLTPIRIGAAFDPEAECPEVEKFLRSVLPDAEVRQSFYELVAYLITANNDMQVAAMFLGGGSNGKSTALSLITALLGQENCSAVPLHQLEDDRFAAAELYGKLANVFADLDARALSSSSMFKAITGGDVIRAERKFRDSFTFRPFVKLLFSANEAPPTPDSSDALFRRWLIFLFEQSFVGREDRQLLSRLTTRDELSGLLNYALACLPNLEKRGRFTEAEASKQAKQQFRVDSDTVAGFIAEKCLLGSDASVSRPDLYRAYKRWADDGGRGQKSATRFNRGVKSLHPQVEEKTLHGTETWYGIGLRGDS
jgi:putative DNA primase/helicase